MSSSSLGFAMLLFTKSLSGYQFSLKYSFMNADSLVYAMFDLSDNEFDSVLG